jgi:hypothetical protein
MRHTSVEKHEAYNALPLAHLELLTAQNGAFDDQPVRVHGHQTASRYHLL